MGRKHFFKPILQEAWSLTWRHKGWWLAGFFSLFLISFISYQFLIQGIQSLTKPVDIFNRWREWSLMADPFALLSNQWQVLLSSPKDYFILAFVWLAIGFLLVAFFALSVYALTTIISGVKQYVLRERFDFVTAVTESWFHFTTVFWIMLTLYVTSNILLMLFSLPVLAFGPYNAGSALSGVFFFLLFALFVILAFLLSVLGVYGSMGAVFDDLTFWPALKNSWQSLRAYPLITIEMFLLQFVVAVGFAAVLAVFVSLLVVPATLIGLYLLSSQQFDVVAMLTRSTFFLLIIAFAFGGAIYALFYTIAWSFLYLRIDKARPDSRIAAFAEMIFRLKE